MEDAGCAEVGSRGDAPAAALRGVSTPLGPARLLTSCAARLGERTLRSNSQRN